MQKEPFVADKSFVFVSAFFILLVSAYCVGAAVPAISLASKLVFYGICFLLCVYVFVELLTSGSQLYLKGSSLFYLSFIALVFWIFLRAENIKGLFLAFQTLLLLMLVVVPAMSG